MVVNITFLSFLLFSMCKSIHDAVNNWINCSFFILIIILTTDQRPLIWEISNSNISATGHLIRSTSCLLLGSVFGVGGSNACFPVRQNNWEYRRNTDRELNKKLKKYAIYSVSKKNPHLKFSDILVVGNF